MERSGKGIISNSVIQRILRVLFLWGIITLSVYFSNHWNESDVLPLARQFMDRQWLPTDWYLNLRTDYRVLFDILVGSFLSKVDFQTVSLTGCLLEYLAYAFALDSLYRALHLRFEYGAAALALFLGQQFLVAGEWMIGGLETKVFAYLCVLFSISLILNERYRPAFFLAGLAFSFHPLIGMYSFFCLCVALFCIAIRTGEFWKLFKSAWLFLVSGLAGFFSIFQQLRFSSSSNNRAWEIYVLFRLPRHLYPAAWQGLTWIWLLGLSILLIIVLLRVVHEKKIKFLLIYLLCSVGLFGIGLIFYSLGLISWLRFYWFRLADVMIPFLLPILLLSFLSTGWLDQKMEKFRRKPKFFSNENPNRSLSVLILILTVFISLGNFATTFREYQKQEQAMSSERTVFAWIAGNTPKEAVFLVDPTLADFYLTAQRSMFCSLKHLPSYEDEILEWHDRLSLCNGGKEFNQSGATVAGELQDNFYQLSLTQIKMIARQYAVSYYLGNEERQLNLPLIYDSGSYRLYLIN